MQVSTDEVYGSMDRRAPGHEEHAAGPNSPYSASKAGSDLLVARLPSHARPGRVDDAAARNNYGPYQFPEKMIPLFVTNLLEGEKVPLYGDGMNVRDWLHVDDHCRGSASPSGGKPARSTTSAAATR